MTGYTPLVLPGAAAASSANESGAVGVRKTTVLDVMRRLTNPKNMMVSANTKSESACYMVKYHSGE